MRRIVTLLVVIAAGLAAAGQSALAQSSGKVVAPFVPTASEIADRMLALAQVGQDDYVIDLGSGDGRLVIAAVARFGARGGKGIEIDAGLVKRATEQAARAGVADRVTFVAGDLFLADVQQATVVTLYLLPSMLAEVETKLRKELRPGTRIVSHDYPLPTWQPEQVIRFDTPEKELISGSARTVLLLYRVP